MNEYGDVEDAFVRMWLDDVVAAAAPQAAGRALQLTAHGTLVTKALLRGVGKGGAVVVVESDRHAAAAAAAIGHPSLTVVNHRPDGTERYGSFDVACAVTNRVLPWPLAVWARLLAGNLRLGGRFVLDLPAPEPCHVLTAAWTHTGAPAEALDLATGPGLETLEGGLRDAGLRAVTGAYTTHLVHVDSPRQLAAFALAAFDLDPAWLEDLVHALTAELRTAGPADVTMRRLRVTGMR